MGEWVLIHSSTQHVKSTTVTNKNGTTFFRRAYDRLVKFGDMTGINQKIALNNARREYERSVKARSQIMNTKGNQKSPHEYRSLQENHSWSSSNVSFDKRKTATGRNAIIGRNYVITANGRSDGSGTPTAAVDAYKKLLAAEKDYSNTPLSKVENFVKNAARMIKEQARWLKFDIIAAKNWAVRTGKQIFNAVKNWVKKSISRRS